MEKESRSIIIFFLLSLTFLVITNSYFEYNETIIHGGSDGFFYIKISESFPYFGENIEYIKGERFIIPYFIGLISKILNIEIFLIYRFFVFIVSIYFIYLLIKIFKSLNLNFNTTIISFSLIIFNPYLLRYFFAVPTMLGDFIFIISTLIIVDGLLKDNKKNIFFGFLLSIITRQNGLFFFVSFLIAKLIFRNKSIFEKKDIVYFSIILLITFLINTFYASNSSPETEKISDLYLPTLFGIFIHSYNLKQFILFVFFPFLSFGPIILLFIFKKINFNKENINEKNIIILISCILIIGIAFASGPYTTGKNLLRLSNLALPMIIILINLIFKEDKKNSINKNLIFYMPFFVLWSFHPTFSAIKIFEGLKNIF